MSLLNTMENTYLSWRRRGKNHEEALEIAKKHSRGIRKIFEDLKDKDYEVTEVANELDKKWKDKKSNSF